jgi:hypothetical protein
MTPYLVNGSMGIHISTVTLRPSKTGFISPDTNLTFSEIASNANKQNSGNIGVST